jgi:hypothetical protein
MKVCTVLVPLGIGLAAISGFAYRSIDDQAPTTTNEVLIRPGENGCVVQSVEGPEFTEVRQVVLPQLELDETNATTTANVRRALLERYGSRVTESAVPMHYTWWWNPATHRWEIICVGASQFTIDFGSKGSVVVDSQDRTWVGEHLTGPAPHGS